MKEGSHPVFFGQQELQNLIDAQKFQKKEMKLIQTVTVFR